MKSGLNTKMMDPLSNFYPVAHARAKEPMKIDVSNTNRHYVNQKCLPRQCIIMYSEISPKIDFLLAFQAKTTKTSRVDGLRQSV